MSTQIDFVVTVQKELAEKIDELAIQLHIAQGELVEPALQHFLQDHHQVAFASAPTHPQLAPDNVRQPVQLPQPGIGGKTVIDQGDVFWLKATRASGPQSEISHPYVVIQDNLFNHSRIDTVVVCALTSNRKQMSLPGNVLLEAGEANLPKQSVVEVSKVSSVEKTALGEYIGSLSTKRVEQILAGMRFLQRSFF